MSAQTPADAAAAAIVALARAHGGSLTQTEAHRCVRVAYGGVETSMRTWRAARAARDALAAGDQGKPSTQAVATAVERGYADDGTATAYPRHLYGGG